MALSVEWAGTAAYVNTNQDYLSWGGWGGTQSSANNVKVMFVGAKPYTCDLQGSSLGGAYYPGKNNGTVINDSGWGANGTTANGSGTGSVVCGVGYNVGASSSLGAGGSVTSTASPIMGYTLNVKKTTSAPFSFETTKGSDATATGTTVSCTGEITLSLRAGDLLVGCVVHNDDVTLLSNVTLSVEGCTLGTQTLHLAEGTTSGSDLQMHVISCLVESGTASGPPVLTATSGTDDSAAQASFIRIREDLAEAHLLLSAQMLANAKMDYVSSPSLLASPAPASVGQLSTTGTASRLVTPTPAASGTTTVIHYGDAALAVNPTEVGAGRVTSFRSASLTTSPAPAASGTVTRSGSAALLVGPTNLTEAAAGFVTDYGTAALLVTPTEFAQTVTYGAAALATNPTELASGTTNHLGSDSLLVTPTSVAAGTVTRTGSGALLVNITEVGAGFVTDTGSAALLVDITEAGAGTKSIPAAAHDVVTATDMVEAAAGAKSIPATGALLVNITEAGALTTPKASTGALTVDPTEAAAGQAWTTKWLRPDALLVETGLSGPVANIQDSPTAPDGTYLSPTGGAIDLRMSFEDSLTDMRTGTGDQIIRVRVVKG